MKSSSFALALVLASFAGAAGAAETRPFSGTVLDPDGRPAAGITVGAGWFEGKREMPVKPARVVTDAQGRFSGEDEVGLQALPAYYMAFNADRTLGAYFLVKDSDALQNMTLRLRPLVPVKLDVRVDGEAAPMPIALVKDVNDVLMTASFLVNPVTLKLLPGEYRIDMFTAGDSTMPHELKLAVAAPGAEQTVDLRLKSAFEGGAAPEWEITDARGLAKTARLADLRGKWVILDFWGYWCKPCVQEGLPRMMEFYDAHKAHHDKFAIIAIHDSRARTFADLDPHLAKLRDTLWKRDLPFPILIDGDGVTCRGYDIGAFPTVVIIDPQGRIHSKNSTLTKAELAELIGL